MAALFFSRVRYDCFKSLFCALNSPSQTIKSEEKSVFPRPVTRISPSAFDLSVYAFPKNIEDATIAIPKL